MDYCCSDYCSSLLSILSLSTLSKKIEYIKRSQVITINNDELIQDDFILYNYGIPLEIKNSGIVEVVLPTLDSEGQLMYHYSFHYYLDYLFPSLKSTQEQKN